MAHAPVVSWTQIAKHLPAILRWALGAEHEVRVASVSFLVSLGQFTTPGPHSCD